MGEGVRVGRARERVGEGKRGREGGESIGE